MSDKIEESKFDEEQEEEVILTPAQRFKKMFDVLGDLFFLNIYFTISCIPIVTIGAAFTALYTVTNKMVNNEEGPIRKEYWNAFKANLKQGIAIWVIDLIYIALMSVEYLYVIQHDDTLSKNLFLLVTVEFFLLALAFPLQFPILARYKNSTGRIILNSLLLAISHLGTWFRMFFIWALPFVLYYFNLKIRLYTWYLWGMILTAIFAYVCSIFLVPFYEKIEEQTSTDE